MNKRSKNFRLKRPKIGMVLAILYFTIAAGLTAYIFMPKIADASSDERLFIPSIGLVARVKDIEKQGKTLTPPDTIAGAYKASSNKTVLIGHSSTIFKDLKNITYGDRFKFDDKNYRVNKIEIVEKATIDMGEIVRETEENTVIIMTCYGEPLGTQDYTHRLIVTAEEV